MSGVSRTESLVACLSKYLPLCSIYISFTIAVYLVQSKGEMAKLLKCRINFEKVRMDYSCHGRYKGIDIVFSLFSLLSS